MASAETPDPSQALVLGLVPGMGHFYTSRPLMGGLTLTTAGMAVVAGLSFQNITVVCLNEVSAGGACPSGEVVRELSERPYFWIWCGRRRCSDCCRRHRCVPGSEESEGRLHGDYPAD